MARHQKQNDQAAEGMPDHAVLRTYYRPNRGSPERIKENGLQPPVQSVRRFSRTQPYRDGGTCMGNGTCDPEGYSVVQSEKGTQDR